VASPHIDLGGDGRGREEGGREGERERERERVHLQLENLVEERRQLIT